MTETEQGDAELAEALAGTRVLVAYGLLGEIVAALKPIGLDYMGAQVAWLRRIGAEVAVVPLPTGAPVAANAARLGAAVLAEATPALIIAHSKGGLEALAALMDPQVAARCRGLVALQSPLRGSPVADALCAVRSLHRTAGGILRMLRLGTGEGLHDLTTRARDAWMREHEEAVAALVARLPVLCVASTLDPETASGPDRRYLPLVRWLARRGAGPNDGLVPLSSALLPGARHMVLTGSHRALVAAGPGRDPVGVLRRALRAVLAPTPPVA